MTPVRMPRRVPSVAGASRWGERQRLLVDLDRRVRTPIPTSRRIAVVGLGGGAGTSTLAAGAAALAAARRRRPVLAVDAAGSAHGLAERLGLDPDDRLTPSDPARPEAQTFADAARGLPQRGALHYLGLGHPASASWPSDVDEWQDAALSIGRFFPLVVTDWGRRRDLRAIADISRRSHTVCLTATADRVGLETAASLVAALREESPRPDVVIALVDVRDAGASATRLRLGDLGATVLRVPFDPSLAAGSAPRTRTRRAWLAVAAELVAPAAVDTAAARAAVDAAAARTTGATR